MVSEVIHDSPVTSVDAIASSQSLEPWQDRCPLGKRHRRVFRRDIPFGGAMSSPASGAVLDVLRLAWCCALMVRPSGSLRQLAPNVVCFRSRICLRGFAMQQERFSRWRCRWPDWGGSQKGVGRCGDGGGRAWAWARAWARVWADAAGVSS